MGKETWWAVALLFLVSGNQTHACFAPPPEYTKPHTDLVRETSRIVLARVTGPSGEFKDFSGYSKPLAQFENIENIKGNTPDYFTIKNGFFSPGQPVTAEDFDAHSQLAFWEKLVTRQWNWPDCVMRPIFFQDRTYLVFLDKPHWRAYEEISAPDDMWLGAVRRLVADPDLASGLYLSADEWLSMAYGVFFGKISNCAGPTLEINRVFHGVFDDEWAYSDNKHALNWPFPECTVGKSYLVVTMADERSPSPHFSWSVFEVSDGVADLSVRHGSEVEIAPELLTLDVIEGALR